MSKPSVPCVLPSIGGFDVLPVLAGFAYKEPMKWVDDAGI
jgi:hypothetical protein